jgi:hypothetical protein
MPYLIFLDYMILAIVLCNEKYGWEDSLTFKFLIFLCLYFSQVLIVSTAPCSWATSQHSLPEGFFMATCQLVRLLLFIIDYGEGQVFCGLVDAARFYCNLISSYFIAGKHSHISCNSQWNDPVFVSKGVTYIILFTDEIEATNKLSA